MNNDNENKIVPYFVHEGIMARLERINTKLWVLCIIMFLALIGSNMAWLYYESQWEVIETQQSVDQDISTGDGNAVVTGIGDIYGKDKANSQN